MRQMLVLTLSLCCCCVYAMETQPKGVVAATAEEKVSGKVAVDEHKVAADEKSPTTRKCRIIKKLLRISGRKVFAGHDVEITSEGCVVIEKGAQLTVRNATVTGVNRDSLIFEDETSALALERATLVFDGDYGFRQGVINIRGTCFFVGVFVRKGATWFIEWNSEKAIFTRHDYATLFLENLLIYKVVCKAGLSKVHCIKNFLSETDFPE